MSRIRYIGANSPEAFERERLRLLEQSADPITIRRLRQLGIRKGWRCLEVGAGQGSITGWLCKQVGSEGTVVATDINPRFLSDRTEANLEVRQHDILNDPLETLEYDLTHCRAVLMHLPNPQRALRIMADSVRPGGWLLIEEGDFTSHAAIDKSHPGTQLFDRTATYIIEGLQSAGIMNPFFGRQLPVLIDELDLVEVGNEATTRVNRGGEAGARFMQMGLQLLKSLGILRDLMPATDLDQLEQLYLDPAFRFVDFTVFAAWGKRPL